MENKILFSLKIDDWLVTSAKFTADGQKAIFCGEGRGLIIWCIKEGRIDRISRIGERKEHRWGGLEVSKCGRFIGLIGENGCTLLLSATSFCTLGVLKMNGKSLCCAFDPQGRYIFTAGTEKKVYVWETSSFKCIRTFTDTSGSAITSIAVPSDGGRIILGSELGILSLYDIDMILSTNTATEPVKTLMNLTTRITQISAHPSCELFAFSSDDKNRSLRLVHSATGRVFSNWPKDNSPLFRVHTIAFNPSGRYMAIGTSKGSALLYSLRHFE